MLIFDIGANRGLFSDACLEKHKDCKIVLIEANPNLIEILKQKYKNQSNIIILNNIADKNSYTEIDFYISNADTISTASLDWINKSRFANNYIWQAPIKIISISLDKLIEMHGSPDLIKIDVEGYEFEVIQGLNKKQKKICFEWTEEEYIKINLICQHLEKLGYYKFGYIFGDQPLSEPNLYTSWNECSLHQVIDSKRKEKWGMIWVQ